MKFFVVGLAGFLIHQAANSQTMNLLCHGTFTHYEVDESVLPFKRTIKSEYKGKKTYVIKNGKLELYPINRCSMDEAKIYCIGSVKDLANPSRERNHLVHFDRLSGEVLDSDSTLAGFKKEIVFDGQCTKTNQKF